MIDIVANRITPPFRSKAINALIIAVGLGIQAFAAQAVLAQTSAQSDLKGVVNSVIDSPTLYDTGLTLKNNFKSAADSVGPQEINAAKLNLPQSFQITTNLRGVGQMVITSPRGAEALSLILQLVPPNPATQSKTLASLQQLAAAGVPEAENFMGYVFEYGLFGAVKDVRRAQQFYLAASQQGYGTATYNLATIRFFAKGGEKQDVRLAQKLASTAADSTSEASYRVCGLASFVNYRVHDNKSALYAQNCGSALAGLGRVAYTKDGTQEDRIKWLQESLSTGANDGFGALLQLATKAPQDGSLMYCHYSLLNQYQNNADITGLKEQATRCYLTSKTVPDLNTPTEKATREQRITGLTGVVQQELATIKTKRASNKFSYSLSVPYLPFHQRDVDAWSKLMPEKTKP